MTEVNNRKKGAVVVVNQITKSRREVAINIISALGAMETTVLKYCVKLELADILMNRLVTK